jgi:integrative and conjugative element protein (TIGR02256 family)
MSADPKLLEVAGERIAVKDMRIPKARLFAEYLQSSGRSTFVKLKEIRRQPGGMETVVFLAYPERPQILTHAIEKREPLAATFPDTDDRAPEVISLRRDFPNVPHLNLGHRELPKSLCLYDQPYEVVRLTWTPAEFLHRIHFWLSKSATGTLHGQDQPLEPLISASGYRLILPADFDLVNPNGKRKPFNVFRVESVDGQFTLRAVWQPGNQKIDSIAAVFWCKPQQHGIISHQPTNLRELQDLCLKGGLNLADELYETIRQWVLDKPAPNILTAKVVFVLVLPKTRQLNGKVESVETRAFITMAATVEQLGRRLGLLGSHGATAGMIIGKPNLDPTLLETVHICLLEVFNALSSETAARLNGVTSCTKLIVAVGAGTLGSQIYNNFMRAGYGRWTLIDNDVLLPHNCARHFLGDWAVGTNKADSMAHIGRITLNDGNVAQCIPADILKPAEHADTIKTALDCAELILDFSASVPVSRHLSKANTAARAISAFLTPRGDGLVIAAEDHDRKVRLDWLEMLHYRTILNEPLLEDSLQSKEARVRYGNSCRDISTELAQDDAALWAATGSKAIRQMQSDPAAALRIYRSEEKGGINVFEPEISVVESFRLHDWAIHIDDWILNKLATLRESRLPNETGGVLLGAFDTYNRICYVVDVVSSPPDSTEWPTSYIRGCEGLTAKVDEVKRATLGQINYIGEWHSHPQGAAIRPSDDDFKAYAWLTAHMQAEALPAIMIIIGDDKRVCLCQRNLFKPLNKSRHGTNLHIVRRRDGHHNYCSLRGNVDPAIAHRTIMGDRRRIWLRSDGGLWRTNATNNE